MASDKQLRSKVDELTETVRELRDEITLLRGAQPGHGCHCCGHVHWNLYHWPYTITMGAAPQPAYTYTVGTTTTTAAPMINTAGAAGYNATYTITN